jgi:hypothetical protein
MSDKAIKIFKVSKSYISYKTILTSPISLFWRDMHSRWAMAEFTKITKRNALLEKRGSLFLVRWSLTKWPVGRKMEKTGNNFGARI